MMPRKLLRDAPPAEAARTVQARKVVRRTRGLFSVVASPDWKGETELRVGGIDGVGGTLLVIYPTRREAELARRRAVAALIRALTSEDGETG